MASTTGNNQQLIDIVEFGGPAALRPVVIDGSNVAMQLGRKVFATRGILIAARYFIERGHRVITFVPQFRRNQRQDNFRRPMRDQHLLDWMFEHELLVYTPSRLVSVDGDQRRRIICYDDYNIVQYAHETGGVIVSKDQYRDVISEHPEWATTVRNRLIMFSWVGEMFMAAEDPFGRYGPRLKDVLTFRSDEDRPAGSSSSSLMSTTAEWSAERRAEILREIDLALSAPPPPPPPPWIPPALDNNDNHLDDLQPAKARDHQEQYSCSSSAPPFEQQPQQQQQLSSSTDRAAELMALPSSVPRFGFPRRDHGSNPIIFHRSRRWMTTTAQLQQQQQNEGAAAAGNGFGPLLSNGFGSMSNGFEPMSNGFGSVSSNGFGASTNGFEPIRNGYGSHVVNGFGGPTTNGFGSKSNGMLANDGGDGRGFVPNGNSLYSKDDVEIFSKWFSGGENGNSMYMTDEEEENWDLPAIGSSTAHLKNGCDATTAAAIAAATSEEASASNHYYNGQTTSSLTSIHPGEETSPPQQMEPEPEPEPGGPRIQGGEAREQQEQEQARLEPALLEFFDGIFPPDIVKKVLSRFSGIHDLELLSNLLADAVTTITTNDDE